MTDDIYCNWLGIVVNKNKVGKNCKNYIENNECKRCDRSPQITELGVKPEDLVQNLKGM